MGKVYFKERPGSCLSDNTTVFPFPYSISSAGGILLFQFQSYVNSSNLHFRSAAEVILEIKCILQNTSFAFCGFLLLFFFNHSEVEIVHRQQQRRKVV